MNSHLMKCTTALAAILCTTQLSQNKSSDLKGSARLLLSTSNKKYPNIYEYKELMEDLEGGAYTEIGWGRNANVLDLTDGNVMKIIHTKHFKTRKLKRLVREIMFSKCLKNKIPNLILPSQIPVPAEMEEFKKLIHILPKAESDLYHLLTNGNQICNVDDNFIKAAMWDILEPLAYLHSANVVHRDVKTENVLVKWKRTIMGWKATMKLCDLDLSTVLPDKEANPKTRERTLSFAGTGINMSPEMERRRHGNQGVKDYTYQTDIWSVACVLAEIYAAKLCFSYYDKTRRQELRNSWLAFFVNDYMLFTKGTKSSQERFCTKFKNAKNKNARRKLVADQFKDSIVRCFEKGRTSKDSRPKTVPSKEYISQAVDNLMGKPVLDLFVRMLDPDDKKRITAVQALEKHEFFESVRKDKGEFKIHLSDEITRKELNMIEPDMEKIIKEQCKKAIDGTEKDLEELLKQKRWDRELWKRENVLSLDDRVQVMYKAIQWTPVVEEERSCWSWFCLFNKNKQKITASEK